jgi:hypothetical protein
MCLIPCCILWLLDTPSLVLPYASDPTRNFFCLPEVEVCFEEAASGNSSKVCTFTRVIAASRGHS